MDEACLLGALEHLSELAVKGTPLRYVKEKIIYHVSSAKQIESSLQRILAKGKSNEDDDNTEEILNILEQYHQKMTATRTLYVTSLPTPLLPSSTFVSRSGFAVLDIHPEARGRQSGDVKPVIVPHDTLPVPSFSSHVFFGRKQCLDLATYIHRSMEQLLPLPLPDFDTFTVNHGHEAFHSNSIKNIPQLPTLFPIHVHIQLLTLCGYPLKQCIPDAISVSVLESLARNSFDSASIDSSYTHFSITHSSSLLSISNSVPLMSAVLASFQRHARQNSNPETDLMYISPEELLSHMANVPEVSSRLEEFLRLRPHPHNSLVYVLPVFSILLPDHWRALLSTDESASSGGRFCGRGLHEYGPNTTLFGSTISCNSFQLNSKYGRERSGSKQDQRSDRSHLFQDADEGIFTTRANGKVGLDTAIVLLRASGESASDVQLPGLVRSMFTSTRMLAKSPRFARDALYSSTELFNAISQAVWDFPPPHVYYSPSSHQIVTDYFWFDSLAWGSVDRDFVGDHVNVNNHNFNGDKSVNQHNFRQSTWFPRLRSTLVFEELLTRAVRSVHLLESLGGLTDRHKPAGISKESSRRWGRHPIVALDDVDKANQAYLNVFSVFLDVMNKAAVAFSHADYLDALTIAHTAEVVLKTRELALHSSELRAKSKYAELYLSSNGTARPADLTVNCKEFNDYFWYHDGDEDGKGSQESSFLSSQKADVLAMLIGAVLGLGGMCLYVYSRGGGSSRRKYYR